MLLSDEVWVVDETGTSSTVSLAQLVSSGSTLPFFDTEAGALTEAVTRFTAIAAGYDAAAAAVRTKITAFQARITALGSGS